MSQKTRFTLSNEDVKKLVSNLEQCNEYRTGETNNGLAFDISTDIGKFRIINKSGGLGLLCRRVPSHSIPFTVINKWNEYKGSSATLTVFKQGDNESLYLQNFIFTEYGISEYSVIYIINQFIKAISELEEFLIRNTLSLDLELYE